MNIPGVKALAFDVGGTVFDWRGAIEREVRSLAAEQGVDVDVQQFATDWRRGMLSRVRKEELPRMNADQIHRVVLDEVLETHDTIQLSSDERDELNRVWHRMKTWTDAVDAIHQLRGSYTVVVLTILSYAIVVDSSKHNGLNWDGIMSCEFLDQYKTHPRAYQQGAELLGLEPSEVMMVAAHASDLKGAKDAGMKTAYVHREDEWVNEYPTPEPTLPIETFDVGATSFDDLVKKLT